MQSEDSYQRYNMPFNVVAQICYLRKLTKWQYTYTAASKDSNRMTYSKL